MRERGMKSHGDVVDECLWSLSDLLVCVCCFHPSRHHTASSLAPLSDS